MILISTGCYGLSGTAGGQAIFESKVKKTFVQRIFSGFPGNVSDFVSDFTSSGFKLRSNLRYETLIILRRFSFYPDRFHGSGTKSRRPAEHTLDRQ
jgi:hypothetical protein